MITILLLLSVAVLTRGARVDEVINKELGKVYRMYYAAKTWREAAEFCQEQGSTLAVPKSLKEFDFLRSFVQYLYFPEEIHSAEVTNVWLGISDKNDYKVWRSVVNGEDIYTSAFHQWAHGNGQHSNDRRDPHCVAMDGVNLLKTYWCFRKLAYICVQPFLKG